MKTRKTLISVILFLLFYSSINKSCFAGDESEYIIWKDDSLEYYIPNYWSLISLDKRDSNVHIRDLFINTLGVGSSLYHYEIYTNKIRMNYYEWDDTNSLVLKDQRLIEKSGVLTNNLFGFYQIIPKDIYPSENTSYNKSYSKEICFYNNLVLESRILFGFVRKDNAKLPYFEEIGSSLRFIIELETMFDINGETYDVKSTKRKRKQGSVSP